MKPTPQQVKEDVFISSFEPPSSNLEVVSHRYGLLEDLVVLGNVPISEVVIRDMGLVHQDRRYQLPKGLASFNLRINPLVTLSVLGYDVPVWSVTLLQGGREIYSPLGVM